MRAWGTRKDEAAELGKDGQALRYTKRKRGGRRERVRVTHPSQQRRRMGHPQRKSGVEPPHSKRTPSGGINSPPLRRQSPTLGIRAWGTRKNAYEPALKVKSDVFDSLAPMVTV